MDDPLNQSNQSNPFDIAKVGLNFARDLYTSTDAVVSKAFTETQSTSLADAHTRSAGLYKMVDNKVKLTVLQQSIELKYPQAQPIGNGVINVHNDFFWCNPTLDKAEVPAIYAQEYELTWGQTVTNLQRILEAFQQVTSGNADPYLTMYNAKETGFFYSFPHLLGNGSPIRQISNTWTTSNDPSIFEAGNVLKNILKIEKVGKTDTFATGGEKILGGVTAGFGFEEAQKYQGTPLKTLTVSFPLYNTIDTKSAFKNYAFCALFAFQNLKTRTSFMTYIPPKMYKISASCNGSTYMPVAIVQDFKVESIGTVRAMWDYWTEGKTNSSILIPEAYKVTITFQELLPQSSNIMIGAMGGEQVSVINPKNLGNTFFSGVENYINMLNK